MLLFNRTENVAFLLGNAGVFVVASLIFNALGDLNKRDQFLNDYLRLSELVTPVSYLRKGKIIFSIKHFINFLSLYLRIR